MEVFNFPFHKCRTKYPDAGAKVQFGRGWIFAASPEAPPSREFNLTFRGMTYYVESDGKTIDDYTWPGLNMKRLEDFYLRHQTHKSFWYEHPVHGFLKVRFLSALDIPDVHEGGAGVVEEMQIQFKEVPGLVGLEYPEGIPPAAPPATYVTLSPVASFSGAYSFVSVAAPPNAYEDDIDFVFTIHRVLNLGSTCQVTWTLGGTVDADDFQDGTLFTGDVAFDADEATKTITFAVKGDSLAERSESIRVSLSNPINCYLDTYTAQCFILNNDGTPTGGGGGSPGSVANALVTETGAYLVTESGAYLVYQ